MEVQRLWNGIGENMTDQTGIWVSTNRAIIWHQLTITFLPLNRSPPSSKIITKCSFPWHVLTCKFQGLVMALLSVRGRVKWLQNISGFKPALPESLPIQMLNIKWVWPSQVYWIQYKYTFYSITQILAQVTFGDIATPWTGMLNTCNGKESGDASPREKIIHNIE